MVSLARLVSAHNFSLRPHHRCARIKTYTRRGPAREEAVPKSRILPNALRIRSVVSNKLSFYPVVSESSSFYETKHTPWPVPPRGPELWRWPSRICSYIVGARALLSRANVFIL